MSVCPNCNKQFEENARFCDACGTELTDAVETDAAETAVQTEAVPAPKLHLPKSYITPNKKVLSLGAAISIIVVIAIIISALFTGAEPNCSLYMKDGELMYYGMRGEPQQITQDTEGIGISFLPVVFHRRNKMFYLINEELFFREINSKKEAKTLATGVQFYTTDKGYKKVLILTKEKELYIHDLKESIKIDSVISGQTVEYSNDLKKIIYIKQSTNSANTDNKFDLYMYNGKESVLIESEINALRVAEDLSTVFYIKDGALYSSHGTKDSKKIDSNVSTIYGEYKNGQIYYIKNSEEGNFDRTSGEISVYYYNGKESLLVAENISSFKAAESQTPIVFYSVYSDTQDGKKQYVAIKDKSTTIDEYISHSVSPDGKSVYCSKIASKNGDDIETIDLYKMDISGKKVGDAELYDTDIAAWSVRIENDGTVWYFKDVKPDPEGEANLDKVGTLYKNKELIQREVGDLTSTDYCERTKTLVFYADLDHDSEDANIGKSLYFCRNGKKPVKVDENVFRFSFTSDGRIMYLKDINENNNGDLYVNKLGKKSEKIDENVFDFCRTYLPEEIKKYY